MFSSLKCPSRYIPFIREVAPHHRSPISGGVSQIAGTWSRKTWKMCQDVFGFSRPKAGLRGLVPYLVSLNLSVTPSSSSSFLTLES